MDILSGTIGNEAISRQLEGIKDRLREAGISTPLRQAKYFTPMLINMIAVGEESATWMCFCAMSPCITIPRWNTPRENFRMPSRRSDHQPRGRGRLLCPAIFLPMWDISLKVK
jgi:hypothetical protein